MDSGPVTTPRWELIFVEKMIHADGCPYVEGDEYGDGHVECECYVSELWDALQEIKTTPPGRLVGRAEYALTWLVKRIDFLDPGSTMEAPNHQQIMAGRVREALAACGADDDEAHFASDLAERLCNEDDAALRNYLATPPGADE